MDEALTYTDFRDIASRLRVDEDIWEELYPMVRDLRDIAIRLEKLTPDLHGDIVLLDSLEAEEER